MFLFSRLKAFNNQVVNDNDEFTVKNNLNKIKHLLALRSTADFTNEAQENVQNRNSHSMIASSNLLSNNNTTNDRKTFIKK